MTNQPVAPTRRQFLGASLAAGCFAATGATEAATLVDLPTETLANELCVFTKPFNSLPFPELAARIKQLGFQGIEAPVRKGGHVEPDQVEDRLPELVDALKHEGLEVTILTSDVNDPDNPLTQRVLQTAAKLGIRRYRMKYFRYQRGESIPAQLERWTGQMKALAQLNRDLKIQGLYQNHSGANYFGAAIWDLAQALESIDPSDLGVAYDLRHATVEGGLSWPTTLRRIEPHIQALYMKDFVWREAKVQNVPLGQGRIDPMFIKSICARGFDGPISLHEEYIDHRPAELVPKHWEAIEKDLATLKQWLA